MKTAAGFPAAVFINFFDGMQTLYNEYIQSRNDDEYEIHNQ